VNRRRFHLLCVSAFGSLLTLPARCENPPANPWADSDLMQPADLARLLNSNDSRPRIICVAFPVLYRQRHIIHAEYAGPGSKPEGIADLKAAVASLPKDAKIVIYCGCCPMVKCPNVRPAYSALKAAGFKNVRVLNIPENFHTNWIAKGYPVEAETGVPARVHSSK
jgi:thiosulfate/3-mercaptopyruvate sulfurtransferase